MSKRAVWKYPMGNWGTGMFSAEMPFGAEVLSLDIQGDDVCMWVLVDPDAVKEQRHFLIVGTGHEYESPGNGLSSEGFVGTFLLGARGSLVFHVFEVFNAAR
jgi:hypothetical protein